MEKICLFHGLSVRASSLADFMLLLKCPMFSDLFGAFYLAVCCVLVTDNILSAAFNVSDIKEA